jgi:hypothetical protein
MSVLYKCDKCGIVEESDQPSQYTKIRPEGWSHLSINTGLVARTYDVCFNCADKLGIASGSLNTEERKSLQDRLLDIFEEITANVIDE